MRNRTLTLAVIGLIGYGIYKALKPKDEEPGEPEPEKVPEPKVTDIKVSIW